jgi:DNA-binding LytR/AlgR family response regulator
MLRILMVEDEPDAADVLRGYFERYCEERDIEVAVSWDRDALDLSRSSRLADLIFMDIELPLTNGMEAATLLRVYDQETPIVFVTNLAQYAIRGYEVNAIDFILKPIRYSDFRMRMDKAMRIIGRNQSACLKLGARDSLRMVPYSEIAYVQTSGHDVAFHCTDSEEPIVTRGSLAQLEKQLSDGPFVRISGSLIVNMAFIRSVRGSEMRLYTGESFELSRNKRKAALAVINNYLGGTI